VPKSYRLGIELMGGYQFSPRISFNTNVTLSRNKIDSHTEYVDTYDVDFNWLEQQTIQREDTDLAFSPSVIAGGDLNFKLFPEVSKHQMELSLLGKYVGRQFIDNSSDENNQLDAYWFSDFRLKYQWQSPFFKEIGITLLVQNIFDRLYESNAWSYRYNYDGASLVDQGLYPQAGRNFLLGVSIGF
jgi:iron complex outermembrane receptor protein